MTDTFETSDTPNGGDDWIAWVGGKCPVEANTSVTVRYRDGWEQRLTDNGPIDRWLHIPSDPNGDIIAYRTASV